MLRKAFAYLQNVYVHVNVHSNVQMCNILFEPLRISMLSVLMFNDVFFNIVFESGDGDWKNSQMKK